MSTDKQPMQVIIDYDTVTYTCPCGETVTDTSSYKLSMERFYRQHEAHTNGENNITRTKQARRFIADQRRKNLIYNSK